MTALSFHIRAWAAWSPGRAEASGTVPMLLRRRVSPLGQQALRAAWSLPETAKARLIFSSRHGEFARTLSILDALGRNDGVSPADFTLSVHHALAGLLSIAQGNRQGHSAVSAGGESFGFGLLEALACLAETPDEPVVLVYYDEPLPPPYGGVFIQEEEDIAIALVIASDGPGEGLRLSTAPSSEPEQPEQAKAFLTFLESGARSGSFRGERLIWHWDRTNAAD